MAPTDPGWKSMRHRAGTVAALVTVVLVCACSPVTPAPSPPATTAAPVIVTPAPPTPAPASPSPLASAVIACGAEPVVKSVYVPSLTCEGAVAAALAALPADHQRITSIAFAFGRYCPPGVPCASDILLDAGYVVINYVDATAVLVSVYAEGSGPVVATGIGPLPTPGPG